MPRGAQQRDHRSPCRADPGPRGRRGVHAAADPVGAARVPGAQSARGIPVCCHGPRGGAELRRRAAPGSSRHTRPLPAKCRRPRRRGRHRPALAQLSRGTSCAPGRWPLRGAHCMRAARCLAGGRGAGAHARARPTADGGSVRSVRGRCATETSLPQ